MLPGETARLIAFAIFCIAGVSDCARRFRRAQAEGRIDFGRMLDPIADKILVGVALMMLVAEGMLQPTGA